MMSTWIGVGLKHSDWCRIRKENRATGRSLVKVEAEVGGMRPRAKDHPLRGLCPTALGGWTSLSHPGLRFRWEK